MPYSCLRIGGLVELAFADGRTFFGRDLVAPLDLDLFLFALLDLGDADDMLAFGDAEDGDALGVAAHHADVADGRADHLALVGDQHQLLALAAGKLATTQPLRSEVSMLVMPWPPRLVRRYS